MSQKFKKTYSAFNREILAEFLSQKELEDLDKKYTLAKIERLRKKIAKDTGVTL